MWIILQINHTFAIISTSKEFVKVSILVELGYLIQAIADRIGDTPEMVN